MKCPPQSAAAINFGIAGATTLTECIPSNFRSKPCTALAGLLIAILRLDCQT